MSQRVCVCVCVGLCNILRGSLSSALNRLDLIRPSNNGVESLAQMLRIFSLCLTLIYPTFYYHLLVASTPFPAPHPHIHTTKHFLPAQYRIQLTISFKLFHSVHYSPQFIIPLKTILLNSLCYSVHYVIRNLP